MELLDTSPPPKKHKKHKHKKHKRSKSHHSPVVNNESDNSLDMSSELDNSNLTAKSSQIKMEVSLSAAEKLKAQSLKLTDKGSPQPGIGISPKIKKKRKRESGTSSEEERWLDAIESGKLDDVDDELKKIKPKDPKLMTARQRAMYERGSDNNPMPGGEVLMALPSGYKEKVMTAEAIQKAALKSKKRKQLADEKREKDKKKTMERLLKKQESKSTKIMKGKTNKLQVPIISYRNTTDGITLSFPNEMPCPLKKQVAAAPPPVQLCQVDGCTNPKKYTCSRTNIPLCSLQCYKRNFLMLRQIII